jgi:hypothetical protein
MGFTSFLEGLGILNFRKFICSIKRRDFTRKNPSFLALVFLQEYDNANDYEGKA